MGRVNMYCDTENRPLYQKNMRFNTGVIDMLKAVDMISKERQTKPGFIGPAVAPYLRTNNFTFSSKTSF